MSLVTNREKGVIFITLFARQLSVWLKHGRSMGYMSKEFKYESGNLLTAVDKFNRFMDRLGERGDEEEIYEQSVTLSEFMEELLALDAKDIVRVTGLIDKIKAEKVKRIIN